MSRFTGRVGVVTGASRGIGFAIAQRLVDEGARVVITGRNETALAEAAARLGPAATGIPGRIDDTEHRDEVLASATELGGLDLLVNNVGVNPVFGPLAELDDRAAAKVLDVNVRAVLGWIRSAVTSDMGERGGSIVTISSIAALRVTPGIGMYAVSKAAVIAMTRQLAVELGPSIRVNAVAPAAVKTRFARALYEGREAEVAATYPLGRLGVPDDVALPVAFLLSDDAAWITGQTLVIDGGLSLLPPA